MAILIILAGVLLLALIFGPQLWIRHVLSRAQADRPDLPGTGAELARHLLDEAGLHSVRVEETPDGDHYDPDARVVRLTPPHHAGRSIAAVAVATHEVAHAVQHARGEPGFLRRQALVLAIAPIFRVAQLVMATIPLVLIFVHSPAFIALQLGAIIALLSLRVLIHAVTLPVELDASFNKALPVLRAGNYLAPADMPQATRVLRAAAFTYVAAALVTLLDVLRWFRR
ncbi:zinc metallopeptidase [Roseomonas stagni]|uniref:Zinc metallopeptidase n=1 Tax=Falsiroseomonas algicola TaxID=2716930 RepID=A0A6M1LTR3_9PROT|nr:zinc metallopeptidase [Falsiroseomonas algicola]NGM23423.1 zinc metallopeptidase [Falsiroseomonas algicola]